MTPYSVTILPVAQRQWQRLSSTVYERIADSLQALASNPRPAGTKKLTGRPGYRIRCGDYRMVYTVDDSARVVTVRRIAHRRDAYR